MACRYSISTKFDHSRVSNHFYCKKSRIFKHLGNFEKFNSLNKCNNFGHRRECVQI